ncbi:MAG: ABC transporter substrate-binding protein [Candidatus Rokubacteria bacterium]|nr:ABC transporter substrate-binding protein [Candidatus Rokubacteria bacterium]
MYGELKYDAGFAHFAYASPSAPKGGEVALAAIGMFDTLNPFVLRGRAAAGIHATFDTLMVASADEPFSTYGLVAERVETPPDRSWVIFTLRPEARFHDGTAITADDVVWTFEALRAEGHPFYRAYYARVRRADALGARRVKFTFAEGENRELPLIVGQMPVLSRRYWSGRSFDATTLAAPLGSGPYRVEAVDPGRSVTYRRVADYWAARLPVNVGRHNFDRIQHEYYRDATVALEAFKAGAYDFRQENIAKHWATAYDVPAAADGRIVKQEIPHRIPTGMQGFVYNTRREIFRDRRVRHALAHAFDFPWMNEHLFYGAYSRTRSYFSNSELAARGRPGAAELALLTPFRDRLPAEVFTREYRPPSPDGPLERRRALAAGLELLRAAGWVVRDFRLVDARTGRPLSFEILLNDPSFERVALHFAKALERLGVDARVRTVDSAQYEHRLEHFDFDMTVAVWPQSLSPGNEQVDYWTSARASQPGSRNLAGITDPAVDHLVARLIAAPDRESLVVRTRALDRVLLWNHYLIPHWHLSVFRVAYWNKFGRPAVSPPYALGFDTWWIEPAHEPARAAAAR